MIIPRQWHSAGFTLVLFFFSVERVLLPVLLLCGQSWAPSLVSFFPTLFFLWLPYRLASYSTVPPNMFSQSISRPALHVLSDTVGRSLLWQHVERIHAETIVPRYRSTSVRASTRQAPHGTRRQISDHPADSRVLQFCCLGRQNHGNQAPVKYCGV